MKRGQNSGLVAGVLLAGLSLAVGCAGEGDTDIADTSSMLASRTSLDGKFRCAVEDPGIVEQDAMEAAADAATRMSGALKGDVQNVVSVYFHIITTDTGGGNVSSLVPAQMAARHTSRAGWIQRKKISCSEPAPRCT